MKFVYAFILACLFSSNSKLIGSDKDSINLFDVVFNEVMADPTPAVELPDAEYIELYNRSSKTIDLYGWRIQVGNSIFAFPKCIVQPDSFLLITSKSNASKLSIYGKTVGLFSSSTTLTNTGQYITLKNSFGNLISWINYDDTWYNDDFKSEGGWALEQIDANNPCGGKSNWQASQAKSGGTPGRKNSVAALNSDNEIPVLNQISVSLDSIIDLYFNESLDTLLATDYNRYEISPDIGMPTKVIMLTKDFSSVRLVLSNHLQIGRAYSLFIKNGVCDCVGNKIANDIAIPVGMPAFPDSFDLVINEVLFNASNGGAEYIEVYNRSSKLLDASRLLIGKKVDNKMEALCRLSANGFLINPSTYVLLTSNVEKVKQSYTIASAGNFIEMADMPSLDDNASTIVLINDNYRLIDEFTYSQKMHSQVIVNPKGVALERVDFNKPSGLPENWHSASETCGYGTPGYKNSQYLNEDSVNTSIQLTDEVFSPDNDGYKDILQISYKFDKPGCRAQVMLFDAAGRMVRYLRNNELLGTQGSIIWDGADTQGKLCSVGIYILFIRTVFDDGTVKEYKKACVLAMH